MVEVSFAQLHGWLAALLWPMVRVTGLLLAGPLWGHSSVPNQVKVLFALLLAVVIVPTLPPMPEVPIVSWAGLGIMVEQLMIGVAMGLVVRVTLVVVQAAGEFIGLSMGLAFATFFSPDTGTQTMVLSRFLYMLTLLMFLAFNGHLMVLEVLAMSFQVLPVGTYGLNPDGFELLVRYGGTIFVAGMLLALPVVGALLIISLSLGVLNRSAPQLTVFNIGFPTSLTVGLLLLTVLMTDLGAFLQRIFSQGIATLEQLLMALAG
ncbi:flagellar biosynthetic protein FliR [Halomonas marinisediminis]|uniref:Flagellar biosynthetic protein FliR n=1 Tax=Halomonas marinisediminis TaxID=2546095 RepID=A0ABY2D5H4_9GAMM|nr:flagellar biosynthetic protein FliR [Halomonas marinisediminis]TDB01928.1 flagellar biosynthetic protein FliR [Halomonas marinisediminis]